MITTDEAREISARGTPNTLEVDLAKTVIALHNRIFELEMIIRSLTEYESLRRTSMRGTP